MGIALAITLGFVVLALLLAVVVTLVLVSVRKQRRPDAFVPGLPGVPGVPSPPTSRTTLPLVIVAALGVVLVAGGVALVAALASR
jgi:hypothetical protein